MSKRAHSEVDNKATDAVAKAKAAFAAKWAKLSETSKIAKPASPNPPTPPVSKVSADIQRRIDEAKKHSQARLVAAQRNEEYAVANERDSRPSAEEAIHGRGGLRVGVHPALQQDALFLASKRGSTRSKFASTLANRKVEPAKVIPKKKQLEILKGPTEDFTDTDKNPYYDPKLAGKDLSQPAQRGHRTLEFSEHGKYIDQANAMRNAQKLEELKARIAASTRKAGLEDELDISGRAIQREEPPDIEWWDEPLTLSKTYDDLDSDSLRIRTDDSPITHLIQHPIPIPAPADVNAPGPAKLMLTETERRKIRRQNRQADQKDKQDKQRLGLIPPEPPKVKLSNLMTVLGSSAVQDPTKVEKQVRAQVQARKDVHEQTNEERKLSAEERAEKARQKIEEDAARGIQAAAWRITYLTNRSLRLKMNLNAEQLGLTGVVILHPRFNLVVAEGGAKSLKAFKKLMNQRIDWTDVPRSFLMHGAEDDDIGGKDDTAAGGDEPKPDLSKNECIPIWEGELRGRGFRRFGFRKCDTDADAKEVLSRSSDVANLWQVAKHLKADDF